MNDYDFHAKWKEREPLLEWLVSLSGEDRIIEWLLDVERDQGTLAAIEAIDRYASEG